MLFNSYEFIFGFLPGTIVAFFLLGRWRPSVAAAFLAIASFGFYAWWDVRYVTLLAASITANYVTGRQILHAHAAYRRQLAKLCLVCGVGINLGLLGYFKYATFFVRNVDAFTGIQWHISNIILPLGISFFTFTQIAFLVDVYQQKAREYNPVHYALFVTYFPHLIAGPILHHKEMMPQFGSRQTYIPVASNFSIGLTIFFIGLFKGRARRWDCGLCDRSFLFRSLGTIARFLPGLGSSARLYVTALPRFFGLLGHGHRHITTFRNQVATKFQFAVQGS